MLQPVFHLSMLDQSCARALRNLGREHDELPCPLASHWLQFLPPPMDLRSRPQLNPNVTIWHGSWPRKLT